MIKPFKITDLGYFLPNEFSNPDFVLDQLQDHTYIVESMWCDGMVACIMCYKNYWGPNWMGFFLISESFNVRNALVLRNYIRDTMVRYDAKRLQTDSQACKVLDDWHEFLGFKYEGTREKLLFNKDYNMWALMRGGD